MEELSSATEATLLSQEASHLKRHRRQPTTRWGMHLWLPKSGSRGSSQRPAPGWQVQPRGHETPKLTRARSSGSTPGKAAREAPWLSLTHAACRCPASVDAAPVQSSGTLTGRRPQLREPRGADRGGCPQSRSSGARARAQRPGWVPRRGAPLGSQGRAGLAAQKTPASPAQGR